MNKKIFITGGKGFWGQEIVKKLIKENYTLTGLARSGKTIKKLYDLGVKPIFGSFENIYEWEQELFNQSVVVHCAAPVEFWEKFENRNLNATKELYRISEKHKVKQFIINLKFKTLQFHCSYFSFYKYFYPIRVREL